MLFGIVGCIEYRTQRVRTFEGGCIAENAFNRTIGAQGVGMNQPTVPVHPPEIRKRALTNGLAHRRTPENDGLVGNEPGISGKRDVKVPFQS